MTLRRFGMEMNGWHEPPEAGLIKADIAGPLFDRGAGQPQRNFNQPYYALSEFRVLYYPRLDKQP